MSRDLSRHCFEISHRFNIDLRRKNSENHEMDINVIENKISRLYCISRMTI